MKIKYPLKRSKNL